MLEKLKRHKIIIGIILLGIVVGIIIGICFFKYTNSKSEITEKNDQELYRKIESALLNNYLYLYASEGDVQIGKGYVVIEEKTYYAVIDEKLENFTSLSSLVKNTIVEGKLDNYLEEIKNANNKYIVVDDKLYVQKGEKVCSNILELDIKKAYVEEKKDYILVSWNESDAYFYYVDDVLKATDIIYKCLDN